MAKKIIIGLMLFFFYNSFLSADPELFIEEQEYDFGVILKGDKLSHIFILKNIGDSDLNISKIFPTCGCLIPDKLPVGILKTGEARELKITLNSADKKIGAAENLVYIHSNDFKNRIKSIKIKYFVQNKFKISPNKFFIKPFIVLASDSQISMTINISQYKSNGKIILDKFSFNKNLFSVNPVETNDNLKLEIRPNKKIPPGKYNETIRFELNAENIFYIPAEFEVLNTLDYSPAEIILSEVEYKKKFDIYSIFNKEFSVEILSFDNKLINAALKKIGLAHFQILVSAVSQNSFNSFITLRLSNQSAIKKITVPVIKK